MLAVINLLSDTAFTHQVFCGWGIYYLEMGKQSKKVLIFGGTSSLAMEVHKFLVREEIPVLSYSRSSNHSFIQVADYLAPAHEISSGETVIIFFAISSPRACEINPETSFAVNVAATNDVIGEVLNRGGNVIFISSDVIYGNTIKAVSESSPLNPTGKYGIQKSLVEETWGGFKGFIAIRTSLNLSNNNRIVQKFLSGDQTTVLKNLYRNVLLTSDLSALIHQILMMPNNRWPQALNAGGNELVDVAHYFTSLAKKMGYIGLQMADWDTIDKACKPNRIQMDSSLARSILKRPFGSIYSFVPTL